MYNVLLRCIHVIIVVIGTLYFIFQVCCSPSYPAYYKDICGLPGCTIFPYLSCKWYKLKKKKVIEHKMYDLIFSKTFA